MTHECHDSIDREKRKIRRSRLEIELMARKVIHPKHRYIIDLSLPGGHDVLADIRDHFTEYTVVAEARLSVVGAPCAMRESDALFPDMEFVASVKDTNDIHRPKHVVVADVKVGPQDYQRRQALLDRYHDLFQNMTQQHKWALEDRVYLFQVGTIHEIVD